MRKYAVIQNRKIDQRRPLPRQLTQETSQRLESTRMPLPQQPARRTPQRRRNNDPKTQNICTTVTMCIHQEVLNSQLVHRPLLI